MNRLGLLLLILPSLTLGQQCNIPGDCIGFSIDTEIVKSHRDCLNHCNSFEKCEWYTYDSRDGFCNVLEDCEVNSNCTTCISGENTCELPLKCFVPGDCSGAYIDHIDVTSAEECLERCYHDYPGCQYFSFYIDKLVCNLYQTCSLDETEADVVSGERDCHQREPQEFTKIFLQHYTNTEWTHMPSYLESGDGKNCSQPADYPLGVHGTASQVVNGSITMCGGLSSGYSNECFCLDPGTNLWVEFPGWDVGRVYTESAMTSAGWWVTGGYNGANGQWLSSTLLWNRSAWNVGPDLPRGREWHCMVQVNSSHTFLAGGFNGANQNDAYFYDWTASSWKQLPNMAEGIYGMGCAHYKDTQGGSYIIMAGGSPNRRLVQSLNLTDPLEWQILPSLPIDAWWGFLVQDGDDLILVETTNGNLLRFNESNQTFSVIQNNTFPPGLVGNNVDVLAIDDNTLQGCT